MTPQLLGFFDSGLGGLTVLRRVLERHGSVPCVYLGDTARVPYGNRQPDDIRRIAAEVVGWLRDQKVSTVVMACNTTNALARDVAEGQAGVPVIGLIGAAAAIPGTVRMIGKQELFKVPIWGQGMIAAEFVPIDRNDPKNSIKSLARAKELMENGVLIWLAPEGTRSPDGRMQPLRKGGFLLARQTDAVIIPIGLRGTETVMPPSGFKINSGKHLSVHVGTPIDTALLSRSEKRELPLRITEDLKKLSGEIA